MSTLELTSIQRIGVFKFRRIGDVLLMTPFLRALRETFPQARIIAIVNAGTESMLANNPHIDEVLVPRKSNGKGGLFGRLRGELEFAQELRKRNFDLTIGLTDGDRTAWYTLFCQARYRLGMRNHQWFHYDLRAAAFHRLGPAAPPAMHEVEKPFWLMEQLGVKLRSTTPGPLCLKISDDQRTWATTELAPLRPAPVLLIHPVSHWLWKCWENQAMAEIIDWLELKRGVRVIVTSGPAPRELDRARAIVQLCRSQPRFYEGNLPMGPTAAILEQSIGYFGIDTAPMHMAAAVGVPVIALFGPTPPAYWRPWQATGEVVVTRCPCDENQRWVCPKDQVRACMSAITVNQAKTALEKILPAKGVA